MPQRPDSIELLLDAARLVQLSEDAVRGETDPTARDVAETDSRRVATEAAVRRVASLSRRSGPEKANSGAPNRIITTTSHAAISWP
jgi:hypothetical protein